MQEKLPRKKIRAKKKVKKKKFMQKEGPGPVAMALRHLSVRLLSSQEFCGSSFAIIAFNSFNKRNCVIQVTW